MHFLLSGCSCALASCRRTEPSICLLSAVVYSRALLHHHRKPLPLHPAANKDTAISASYSQRVHLHAVRKRHVTTTERYFASQGKDHLGSAFFPPVLGSPFHQLQLCMPTLGDHCLCPCGQGGKAAFQRARAFSPRHEYAPFFVVLYSFP